MKVYFTASISQRNELGTHYQRIRDLILKKGHQLESGNLFEMTVGTIEQEKEEERLMWYRQAMKNIAAADLIVVEISMPSTVNVGHELSVALEKGKPVVALYEVNRDPIFLRGRSDDKLLVVPYTDMDLEKVLESALEYASDQSDTRFNFFVSPKHQYYLDWVSKNRKIPRAVYLRRLIEDDMKDNKDYNG